MKTLKNRYKNSKFQSKLMIIFVLTALLPIALILTVSFVLNAKNMTDKVDQLMINNLVRIADRTNLNLQIYTNSLYQMYQDELITENIKILMDNSSSQAVAYNQINNRLKQYNTADSGIRCISVICSDGKAVEYDFETDSYMNNLWKDYKDLRKIQPYKDAIHGTGSTITPTMTFQERGEKKHYFHISKKVFDADRLEQGSIATIVMTIDEQVLNSICNTPEQEEGMGINFPMTEEDVIVAYPDAAFSGVRKDPKMPIEDFVEETGLMKNKNLAVNSYEDPVTGWTFYNAYNKDIMLRDVVKAQLIYIMIGVLAIVGASAAIFCLVKDINRSVHQVVDGIKEVQEGNLDVTIPITQHDEIGDIAENFNKMTAKVKQLIREVKEAVDRQKNAELRALEAQINPHFLYNTLDSINWMAIEQGEYEISKMLRNLGVILRYSIDKSNGMVTIKDLEDWIEKYMSLQQMRFEGVFTFEVYVEDAARKKWIYKLLLQPFIENAILHGLKDMDGDGLLRVDIGLSPGEDRILLIIEDNGKGMPENLVELYNDPIRAVEDESDRIGLQNAFSRLRMYYKDQAEWHVNSISGMGTVITLRVPIIDGGK